VSSHLMSEMALTADQLIIVGRGRLIADVSVDELTLAARPGVRVRSPQSALLRVALAGPDVSVTTTGSDVLEVDGLDSETVGRVAAEHGAMLFELVPRTASLEEAFMDLTRVDVEYRGSTPEPALAGRSAS
jgi:ABC-2 type transport system ATP-binding protein